MKLTRIIVACTLLLLASVPAFALPQCGECVSASQCQISSESVEPCRVVMGVCEYYFSNCTRFAPEPVAVNWTVASIEISRSAPDTETVVTTPADEAEACPTETAKQK